MLFGPAGRLRRVKLQISDCGILRYPMTESLAREAADFVVKGLSGHDACYAALAKELKGTWLTFDNRAHKLIQKDKLSHVLSKNLPENWVN